MGAQDVAGVPDGVGSAPAGQSARPGSARHARSRWLVHLGLLATVAAALATLQLLHIQKGFHVWVGLAFAALAIWHLAQRRHRIARMVAQVMRRRPWIEQELRLLASDAVLAFIALNVTVSGVIDWHRGAPTLLPVLPLPFDRWHLLSSVALLVYLVVHVSRRWRRLRRSTIR